MKCLGKKCHIFEMTPQLFFVFVASLMRHVCHTYVKSYGLRKAGVQPCTALLWKHMCNVPCRRQRAPYLPDDATGGKADRCPARLAATPAPPLSRRHAELSLAAQPCPTLRCERRAPFHHPSSRWEVLTQRSNPTDCYKLTDKGEAMCELPLQCVSY